MVLVPVSANSDHPSAPDLIGESDRPFLAWTPDEIEWDEEYEDGSKLAILEGPRDRPGEDFTYAFFLPDGVWVTGHWHCANAIGIEITEAISTDYSKCLALAEREKPDAMIDMSLFRWGAEPKSNIELREIIHSKGLEGDGWEGESAEIEWSRYIESIVAVKSKKLGSYTRHDEQWLAVYDNLPLPNVHLARAAEKVQPLFNPWNERVRFDALFIEHGPVILEMTAHSITFHQLNDLW